MRGCTLQTRTAYLRSTYSGARIDIGVNDAYIQSYRIHWSHGGFLEEPNDWFIYEFAANRRLHGRGQGSFRVAAGCDQGLVINPINPYRNEAQT